MIVVRLMGGMGNQMFQYAAARALSLRLGRDLCYDLSYLCHAAEGTVRRFELDHFRCQGKPLDGLANLRFGSRSGAPLHHRLLARLISSIQPHRLYEEPSIMFDPAAQSLPDNTVLTGRFQSPHYFDGFEATLREDFRLATDLSAEGQALITAVRQRTSIGVHVRRTDYVDSAAYRNVIQALPLEYYQKALDQIRSEIGKDATIYVISDDIAWCRSQPTFSQCDEFVDLSYTPHPHIEEFAVLSSCQHFVISNSTFAWWAAWLAPDRNKTVIAPTRWSHNPDFDSVDRIPAEWIKI